MFHFDVDIMARYRERYPMPILRRFANARKFVYVCHIKTKPDSLIYRGYRDSILQR